MITSTLRRTPVRIGFCILLLIGFSPRVLAGVIGPGTPNQNQVPSFTVKVDSAPTLGWNYTPPAAAFGLAHNPQAYVLTAPSAQFNILGGRALFQLRELEFDPDPFVVNNILITNTTTTTQIYTVGIALPTSFPAPNVISGNVRTDVIDAGGDPGATVSSVAGFPIYTAQIDFTTVATLQDDPFSVVAPPASSAGSFASFGPDPSAVAVTSNIGIQLRFSLSPGDTVAILSRFDVVPEPSGALAIGGLVLWLVGLRRNH